MDDTKEGQEINRQFPQQELSVARRYKDQRIILPDEMAGIRARHQIKQASARRQAYLDRYAAATAAALAQAKANPDYQIIVEYLAVCSAAELEHMILETLITDVLARGCTLTPRQIRSFLDRDLKLKMWVHQGNELVRTPHGWTRERGPYPIDADTIWESWVWYPPADSEWSKW